MRILAFVGDSMISKSFKTTIVRDGSMCFLPLTFDPKAVFGKVRAPGKELSYSHQREYVEATLYVQRRNLGREPVPYTRQGTAAPHRPGASQASINRASCGRTTARARK